VKRSLTLNTPEAFYTNAEEIADFGAAQGMLRLRIRQVSEVVGPGAPLEADIPVT
jgi:hypothetical protein